MHHIKATITKQNGKTKPSRGFSLTELANAGLNKQDAKKIGIPLDLKRKSAHDANVATLKVTCTRRKSEGRSQTESARTNRN